jgi:Zn-dependent protease
MMKKGKIWIIRVMGIPIGLDISWFLVFLLFTWILAVDYFPAEFKTWTVTEFWLVAAVTTLLFFVSVLLHELGHSLVALRYKLPVKSITMYIFGGVSEINAEPSNPLQEFVVAFVGPLTSLILGGLFYIVGMIFSNVTVIYAVSKYLAYINILLGIFNLIPGFPLDGGRVFRSIVWGITKSLRKATEIAGYLGHAIAFIFILLGVWLLFQGNWINGLWIAFIGWFLETAVVSQVQQGRINDILSGHTVDQVMTRTCVMASGDSSLQELVDQYILEKGERCMVIMEGDRASGFLTLHNIREVPKERWNITPASQVMTPISQVKVTAPKVGLVQALQEMGSDGVNQMPVIDDGEVAGILRREDIVNYLHLLQKLGR